MNAHNHSDDPYAESEQLWSGNPNDALIREVQGLSVGDAVDVGAGEGADAVWLAKQGWVTTAVEPSAIACGRIAEAATKAAVQVTIMQETLASAELGTYDLVSAFYMPLTLDTVPVLCAPWHPVALCCLCTTKTCLTKTFLDQPTWLRRYPATSPWINSPPPRDQSQAGLA